MRNLFLFALAISMIFLLPSSAISAPAKATATAPTPKKVPVRAEVSDFTLDTIDGDSVSLSDFKGKVVVVFDGIGEGKHNGCARDGDGGCGNGGVAAGDGEGRAVWYCRGGEWFVVAEDELGAVN